MISVGRESKLRLSRYVACFMDVNSLIRLFLYDNRKWRIPRDANIPHGRGKTVHDAGRDLGWTGQPREILLLRSFGSMDKG